MPGARPAQNDCTERGPDHCIRACLDALPGASADTGVDGFADRTGSRWSRRDGAWRRSDASGRANIGRLSGKPVGVSGKSVANRTRIVHESDANRSSLWRKSVVTSDRCRKRRRGVAASGGPVGAHDPHAIPRMLCEPARCPISRPCPPPAPGPFGGMAGTDSHGPTDPPNTGLTSDG